MAGKKIVECVPNFSEGRDQKIVDEVSASIRGVDGVKLLDVDPGASTNRTVYTFVGSPDAVVEAALAAATTAHRLIDMTKHKGAHPRIGALDVCPFIPVSGVTVDECVALSKVFGRRLAEALGVPVYLYGSAAEKGSYRTTMPQIRAGEYEGLENKLKDTKWQPDFGPSTFVPRWGATVTGVRKFLIAYNVNMLATKEQAHRIALNLRSQGRGEGQPGRLSHCQAIGWFLEERNIAQISINLIDFDVTPMHIAYEEACKDAAELKLPVTGSEVVGLVPLKALLQAADYYIEKEDLFILEEEHKIQLAINRLGLSQLSLFDPKERVIEYCLEDGPSSMRGIGPLGRSSLASFVRSVAARTAAPGGGSVAATVAAMGAALGAMAGQLTYGKRQWEHLDDRMRRSIPPLHQAVNALIPLIDHDTQAFSDYMATRRLPKKTEDEETVRAAAIEAAARTTVEVPLSVMRSINTVWSALTEVAAVGNINCISDVQVGVRCLETGSWGAYYNVLINLDNITEKEVREAFRSEAQQLLNDAQNNARLIINETENRKQ